MPEHETWLTALFNQHLAWMGNAILNLVGLASQEKPWANFVTMQIVVVLAILVVFALLRPKLSVDRPNTMQHLFELILKFLRSQTEEVIGHHGLKYVGFFGTIFIFILFSNLLGAIPTFESPTMFPYVTVGCALASFLYYNGVGIAAQGAGRYMAHFLGPVWWLSPLMLPIELVSHVGRPLSLSVRLFANMYAGEQVLMVFLGLTYLIAPVIFMGLHVFVAFLQAYIFVLLTMIYVGGATEHEH
jgi:F-type H+-transporting ATPase subunit a